MAPKSLPPAAKQALIVSHLLSSRTCHTFKDLEGALPSVASINRMQVKDYVQALTDEGKLRVEKIGSGNWYWIFASDGKREKEQVLAQLGAEKEKIDKVVGDLQERIEGFKKDKAAGGDDDEERKGLEDRYYVLKEEVEALRAKEAAAVESGTGQVERKKEEVMNWKKEAEELTDNIYVLEAHMSKLVGGDREMLQAMLMDCYGAEYVEDEGLRELVFD